MTVNPIETLRFTPHPCSKRAEASLPFFALFDGLAEGGCTFTEEKHSGGDWVIRGLIGGGKHVLEQRYFFRRTKSTKMKQRIAVKRRDL